MNVETIPSIATLTFRPARSEEARQIAQLVNSSYRGESSRRGWTTEADLLDGQRTDEQEILELIQAEGSLILLCLQGAEVIGSVNLQKVEDAAYLGMLVIRPDLQARGIGRQFIQAAEALAYKEWGVSKMVMSVITLRAELLAFYERRGYRRTGQIKPFPTEARAGIPLVDGLQFEILEKELIAVGTSNNPSVRL